MPRNVEIKARVADLPRMRDRVVALATAPPRALEQTDTFFPVPGGRLKLRRGGDGTGELILYQRPDRPGPKESAYFRMDCPDPAGLDAILSRRLGARGVVEKRREVFLVGRARIHLDEVRDLGTYLEIEVVLADREPAAPGEREARALLAALDVPDSALEARAYIDLLESRGLSRGRG
jgi:predicted adenylyl cyclase CyaB